MKYFEVNDPYYAMIKAENTENALKLYEDEVADAEEGTDLQEVDPNMALIKYSQALGEDNKLNKPINVYEDFFDNEQSVLLIDGLLI